MSKRELKRNYRSWQQEHPNFMTPDIEKIQVVDDKIIELASGERLLSDKKFFGVSVLEEVVGNKASDGFETIHEFAEPFDERKEAEKYIEKVKEKLKGGVNED